jgi:phosphatidylglycerophosphatase A
MTQEARLPKLGLGTWLATGMGLGFLRPAPGTWGSLPPVVLAGALALAGTDGRAIDMAVAATGLLFGVACLLWGADVERVVGRKDPGQVVSDEIAGQSIALLWLPWNPDPAHVAIACATAFLSFRLFDIVKPPPARGWQRFEGGTGILVDDLAAGVYALAATQLVVRFVL